MQQPQPDPVLIQLLEKVNSIFKVNVEASEFYFVKEDSSIDFSKSMETRSKEIDSLSDKEEWTFKDLSRPVQNSQGEINLRLVGLIELYKNRPTGNFYVHQTQRERNPQSQYAPCAASASCDSKPAESYPDSEKEEEECPTTSLYGEEISDTYCPQ
jgi:hypothetical protein